jgi:hypothetical protein
MRQLTFLLVLALCSALAFSAGWLLRQDQLLRSAYITTKPLALSVPHPGHEGLLPAGAILYNYGGPDEQPMFILFVGTKQLDSMTPIAPKHWLEISPTVAFSQ